MEKLNKKIKNCARCKYHRKKLLGEGNEDADVFLLGESPSLKEDRNNIIFGGKSEEIFYSFVDELELKNYYLTNAVKCYEEDEGHGDFNNCLDFLMEEINIVDPEYVISFGKKATELFQVDNYDMKGYRARCSKSYPFVLITVYHPMYVIYHGISKEKYLKIANRVKNELNRNRWF